MSPRLRRRAINWYLDMLERSLLYLEEASSTTSSLYFGLLYKSVVAAPGVPAYPFQGCSWIVLTEYSPSISYRISDDAFYFFFWRPLVLMWSPYSSLYHAAFSRTCCRYRSASSGVVTFFLLLFYVQVPAAWFRARKIASWMSAFKNTLPIPASTR